MLKKLFAASRSLALLCVSMASVAVCAQTTDDKVVISQETESFVLTENDGSIGVRHMVKTEYMLNSQQSQTVHPSTYYNGEIKLERAQCGRNSAQHESITPENVFYDDTKVCFFTDVLTTKHKRLSATFQRFFPDYRYCARIFLCDEYFVRQKVVTVTIPHTIKNIRLVPMNFDSHISVQCSSTATDSVFVYTIADRPDTHKKEAMMPPHVQLCPYILMVGAFDSYQSLYRWCHAQTQVDTAIDGMDALLQDITSGCQTDTERLAATYRWVQQNIRYVAFEAGASGHQPDRPAEVVRKRFGDCKGMALLLRTLLSAQGFDARLAYIGTDDIPYQISDFPSLASVDHMACVVFHQGRTYWLDATYKHTPMDYVPQAFQGKEVMVEAGDSCRLLTAPTLPVATSVDSLCYDYRLTADGWLSGHATYTLAGDMEEFFMMGYERKDKDEKHNILSNFLNADDHRCVVSNVAWCPEDSVHGCRAFGGDVVNDHAVLKVNDEQYVELNPHNNLYAIALDTLKRRHDFRLPVRGNVVREVRLHLPTDAVVSFLPNGFRRVLPQGELSCTFEQREGMVVYRQRLSVVNPLIARQAVPEWNAALQQWLNACNEQIILKHKSSLP